MVNQHSSGKSPYLIGDTSSKGPFSIAMLGLPECSPIYNWIWGPPCLVGQEISTFSQPRLGCLGHKLFADTPHAKPSKAAYTPENNENTPFGKDIKNTWIVGFHDYFPDCNPKIQVVSEPATKINIWERYVYLLKCIHNIHMYIPQESMDPLK